MNEEKDLAYVDDLTKAQVNEICDNLLAKAEAHLAEAEILRSYLKEYRVEDPESAVTALVKLVDEARAPRNTRNACVSCASIGQVSTRSKPYETHPNPPPHGSSGTARAARSLRRRLAGAKRIEAVLKPEAAAALTELQERTGRAYSAIIERLVLAERKRVELPS